MKARGEGYHHLHLDREPLRLDLEEFLRRRDLPDEERGR